MDLIQYPINFVKPYIFSPTKNKQIAVCLLIFEAFLSIFIIKRVKYTEIDWVAYMQEVEGFLNGTYDYAKLSGQTGPLVYPAGFVYIYSVFYYLTNQGKNIVIAQYIFAVLYLLNLALVFAIYIRTIKIPPVGLVFMCCTSYRIHSIFMLRLFNDPLAMIFFYSAVNALLSGRYSLGCVLYSLAVSIKMNVLLFAPALGVILLINRGLWHTVGHLAECGIVQVVLAFPFLIHNTNNYLTRAFEFQRQFLFKWTVNWRFLPVWLFEHRTFHAALLALHLLLLCIFIYAIIRYQAKHVSVQLETPDISRQLTPFTMVLLLFVSNFIGVAVSRSLHYQFYVWYFHSLLYLLYCTQFRLISKLLILGLIEMCWNVYPSTVWSSACLHLQHALILVGLWIALKVFTHPAAGGELGPRQGNKSKLP